MLKNPLKMAARHRGEFLSTLLPKITLPKITSILPKITSTHHVTILVLAVLHLLQYRGIHKQFAGVFG